jgi:hypothetical protein
VEPYVYLYVRDAVKAKEAWNELAKVFEDKVVNRRITLIDILLNERLKKPKSMHDVDTKLYEDNLTREILVGVGLYALHCSNLL